MRVLRQWDDIVVQAHPGVDARLVGRQGSIIEIQENQIRASLIPGNGAHAEYASLPMEALAFDWANDEPIQEGMRVQVNKAHSLDRKDR